MPLAEDLSVVVMRGTTPVAELKVARQALDPQVVATQAAQQLAATTDERYSVLNEGADPNGERECLDDIMRALWSGRRRIWVPHGRYNLGEGERGLDVPDNTVIEFEAPTTEFFGRFAGPMLGCRNAEKTRSESVQVWGGTLNNTDRKIAGGIGFDARSLSCALMVGTTIKNVETTALQGGLGSFYNSFWKVTAAGVIIGWHNGALGNDNNTKDCRVVDCDYGTLDTGNSGSGHADMKIEQFRKAAHKTYGEATQFIRFRDSRIENGDGTGIGFDIGDESQDTQISGAQVIGVERIITEYERGGFKHPTGIRTNVNLSEYLSLYGGPAIRAQFPRVGKASVPAMKAGECQRIELHVPDVLDGDFVTLSATYRWPGLMHSPLQNGGRDTVFLDVFAPRAVDAFEADLLVNVTRYR